MNKILILLVAVSCSLGMNAQNNERALKKAVKSRENQKAELASTYYALKNSNAIIEKRTFVTESPEQSLRKILASYKDIKEMADNDIFDKNPEYEKLPFAGSYISLIQMYKSLSEKGGYDQKANEDFIRELDVIKERVMSEDSQHNDSFKQSFEDLDNCIRNYRFAMFELARIFALVKEKEEEKLKPEPERIYGILKEDDETYFVDKIPYTKNRLINYINCKEKRSEIMQKLTNSCAEAFEDFKE